MWARKKGKVVGGTVEGVQGVPAKGIEAQTNTGALRYNIFTMSIVIRFSGSVAES